MHAFGERPSWKNIPARTFRKQFIERSSVSKRNTHFRINMKRRIGMRLWQQKRSGQSTFSRAVKSPERNHSGLWIICLFSCEVMHFEYANNRSRCQRMFPLNSTKGSQGRARVIIRRFQVLGQCAENIAQQGKTFLSCTIFTETQCFGSLLKP